jgi:hypothetical protein
MRAGTGLQARLPGQGWDSAQGFRFSPNGLNPGRQQFGPVAIQGRRLNGKPAVSKTVFGGSNPSAPAMV